MQMKLKELIILSKQDVLGEILIFICNIDGEKTEKINDDILNDLEI